MTNDLQLSDFSESIQKGFKEYDLEKATYANNAQNRKLGRVGNEYGGGKKEKESSNSGKKVMDTFRTLVHTLPNPNEALNKFFAHTIESSDDKRRLSNMNKLANELGVKGEDIALDSSTESNKKMYAFESRLKDKIKEDYSGKFE